MFQRGYVRSNSTLTTATSDKTHQKNGQASKGFTCNVAAQQLARTTKSHFQLISSFCQTVTTISTLRQPTPSTATAAITTSGHSNLASHPLINLLKLFLFYGYYLVAVASLLIIIFYMNNLAKPTADAETFMPKSEVAMITSMLEKLDSKNDTLHIRVSRSIPEVTLPEVVDSSLVDPTIVQPIDLDLLAETISSQVGLTHLGRPNSSFNTPSVVIERRSSGTMTFESHRIHHHQLPSSPTTSRVQQQTNTKNIEDIAQSETGGVAQGYSVNNRGILTSASSISKLQKNSGDNQGQWIPITKAIPDPPQQSLHYGLPDQDRLKIPKNQQHDSTELKIKEPLLLAQTYHHPGDEPNRPIRHHRTHQRHHLYHNHHQHHREKHFESHHHHRNYPNLHLDSHPTYNRHWRRPRFNPNYDGPPRMSKLYKVVLICEKTLVSMDYIKRFTVKPKPYEGPPSDDFLDNNDIDLDSHLDPIFAAAAAGRRQADNVSSSISPSVDPIDMLATSDASLDDLAKPEIMKRSYLSEEDPLVRCDMWDLEKGLKNRKPPRELLLMAVRADFETVRDAINRCRQLSEKMLPPDDEYRGGGGVGGIEIMSTEDLISVFSMKRGLIPGTKWCGLGDIASSYNDLGPKHRIDICCRAHDHCPIRLKPFRNDYGILNIALYTKSHCDCDADFYRCLREVHSRTADMLGNLYFNVMKLQCMREERMKVCREMKPIALGFERCVRYGDSPMRTVFKFTTPPVAY